MDQNETTAAFLRLWDGYEKRHIELNAKGVAKDAKGKVTAKVQTVEGPITAELAAAHIAGEASIGVAPVKAGHDIGAGFAKDNGGAIPPNLLSFPNTESNGRYLAGCKAVGESGHPARFPGKLPEFFIRFLTDPGDTVLDIFAGSNTTGEVAEREGRRWMAFEERRDYVAASAFRFADDGADLQALYDAVMAGDGTMIERDQSAMLFK